MTASALILCLLLALLACAVATDLRARRIPNRLVLTGLALALAGHGAALVLAAPPLAGAGLAAPLLGTLAGLAALLPLYLLRACGAGDVKLMAMAGAFIGAERMLTVLPATLVAGGVLALVVMLARGITRQTLANTRFMLTHWLVKLQSGGGARLDPLAVTTARLPYAVAIASGVVVALVQRPALA
jgi:prepilin peptidase CpaA